MAAVETQSRLAVSIPSMLMTYWTGAGTATTTTTTTTPDATLSSDVENTDSHPSNATEPRSITPAPTHAISINPRNRHSLSHTPQSGSSTAAPSPTKSFPSMMFDENMSHTSDGHSREGSVMSATGRPRKRSSKPKTSYTICQPPPKSHTRQKIHVRRRPLLQLHRLSHSARPTPAFELLPSAIFSATLTRAIAKTFRGKHVLCPTDLAIVLADSYHDHENSATEADESRDVLALICKGRKGDSLAPGSAKIFFKDGSEYEAYALPNGGYEFSSTDSHGLTTTMRWVLKRPRGRRSQSANEMESPRFDASSKKFTFSTISSNSRRHPIIASLTSTALDINDSYNMPAALPAEGSPSAPASLDGNEAPKGDALETTDELRTIITATAIWVALREGWCPGYRYEDSITRSPSLNISRSPSKAVLDLADATKEDGPQRSVSLARMFRTASTLKRRSTASAATDGSAEDVVMSRRSSVHSNTGPRRRPRAESAATVIHRTAWPRPISDIAQKHNANSNSTHGFGLDHGEEMTEEEEGEDTSTTDAPVPQAPVHPTTESVLPSIEVSNETAKTAAPNHIPLKNKRESTATDATVESKKMEARLRMRRKRGKAMRVLLCGMA